MPCVHKFQHYLQLNNLDFEPTTLIVGTFNPSWPEDNNAQWFYGRTHDVQGNQDNNFWDVLPRLYGELSLINGTVEEWKTFCSNNHIAITDIISSIEDADPENEQHIEWISNYSDDNIGTHFFDFETVNLVRLIRTHPTISHIYVTRSFTSTFWKNKMYLLKRYCDFNGVSLKSVITPSGFACFQQGKYNRLHPDAPLGLSDYILMRWGDVWHEL